MTEQDISLATQEKMGEKASDQAATMQPEQQIDGLNMGIDMFTGRIKLLFEDTAKNKSIPMEELCLLVSLYDNNKVRYDIMRLTSREPVTYGDHILQVEVHNLLGLPEFLVYVVKRKLREAILESLKNLSDAEKLPIDDLAFHISHDMKLSLFYQKRFYKQLDLNQIIPKI